MKKDYSTYKVEDFLEDRDFIEWVKTGKEDSFWRSMIEEHSFPKRNLEFAKEILYNLTYRNLDQDGSIKERIWTEIEKKTQPGNRQIKFGIWTWLSAAAAVGLLFIVSHTIFNRESTIIETQYAQRQIITLPDGSVVTLNAESKIEFDKKHFDTKRKIKLNGEAFFEVKKGSTFEVITDYGLVKVLGTSFNIYTREDWIEVSCFTGRVAVVFKKDDAQYLLNPGQKIRYAEGNRTTENFEITLDKSWRSDHFYFEGIPLMHVLHELQRQFGLKEIVIPKEIQNYTYSGYFHKGNLQQAIQSVCLPLQIEGNVVDGTLILKRKE